jgi:hypothetical protein
MLSEFESLRERLLRAGVAPRNVRRYLTELREHLADLTAHERASGHDAREAAIRARAALGDDETLSHAMLARPGARSLSARAPWAVFGLLPPLAVVAGVTIVTLLLGTIAHVHGHSVGHVIAAPLWFRMLSGTLAATCNYGLGFALAILFMRIALRQRMTPVWPLIGIALAVACAALFTLGVYFPAAGVRGGVISVSFLLGPHYPLTPGMAAQVIVWRLLLTLLPAAALYLALRQRLRARAPSV